MNIMKEQNFGVEPCERTRNWLKAHKIYGKVKIIKDNGERIEFIMKGHDKGTYTLCTVYLSNGSWESHEVTPMMLRHTW